MVTAAGTASPPRSEDRRSEGRVDVRRKAVEVRPGLDVQREADRLVLAEHGPPGVVIDDDMNVVQVRGHTAPYLELSAGEPTRNVLKMAREGLIAGLGSAVRTARQTNATAKEDGFRIDSGDELREVTIRVIPFAGSTSSEERYFLVLFEDADRSSAPAAKHEPSTHGDQGRARLLRELAATKELSAIHRRR